MTSYWGDKPETMSGDLYNTDSQQMALFIVGDSMVSNSMNHFRLCRPTEQRSAGSKALAGLWRRNRVVTHGSRSAKAGSVKATASYRRSIQMSRVALVRAIFGNLPMSQLATNPTNSLTLVGCQFYTMPDGSYRNLILVFSRYNLVRLLYQGVVTLKAMS
jgi:hypothetical protein